jgi:diguanylate cyclase (GGDEF)-like protein
MGQGFRNSLAETQLYALIEVGAAAAGAHRLDDVLELAAERALAAMGAASLSISRWDGDCVRTLVNVGDLGPGEVRFPEDETYPLADYPSVAAMLSDGGSVVAAIDDEASDPALRELLGVLGKESGLTVPIVVEGTTWGELWATTAFGQPRFSDRDADFLNAIADQLAAAVGRAELFAQIEALAYTDPLTGLANRRMLEQELERACGEPGGAPTVMLCDIDGLKAVNDAEGHEAGDRQIVRVGRALAAAAAERPGVVVARIGGDEFCALLPTGGAVAASALAREVTERLTAEPGPQASVSCGVAVRTDGLLRPAALLRAADTAQYRAKKAGPKTVVELADGDGPAARAPRGRAYRNGAEADMARELLALIDGANGTPPEELLQLVRARLADSP